jgi:hypothetical protein
MRGATLGSDSDCPIYQFLEFRERQRPVAGITKAGKIG